MPTAAPVEGYDVAKTLVKVTAERNELRRLLYEVIREVPTSAAAVYLHGDLQRLHRRVIAALGEEEPAADEFVRSDYWIGRTP